MSGNDFYDEQTVNDLQDLLGRAAKRGVDVQQAMHSIAAGIGMMTAANVRDASISDRLVSEFVDEVKRCTAEARREWTGTETPKAGTRTMEKAAANHDAARAMTHRTGAFDKVLFDTMYAAMREAFDRGADAAAVLNTLTAHIGFMIGPNAENLKQRRLAIDNAAQLIRGYAKAFAERHPAGRA